jgi:hypothetical protein
MLSKGLLKLFEAEERNLEKRIDNVGTKNGKRYYYYDLSKPQKEKLLDFSRKQLADLKISAEKHEMSDKDIVFVKQDVDEVMGNQIGRWRSAYGIKIIEVKAK